MAERDEGYVRIGADLRETMAFFEGLDVNKKAIQKKILKTVGIGARQAVKTNFTKVLHKRTGKLVKSVKSLVAKSGNSVVITNTAESGKNTAKDGRAARYGFMLAQGYTITAKNAKTLTFNINGQWIRKHSVTVPPKDWVEPSVEKYVASGECRERMDKEFQRQVNYWEKRITGGRK